jgi:hypothetical protein
MAANQSKLIIYRIIYCYHIFCRLLWCESSTNFISERADGLLQSIKLMLCLTMIPIKEWVSGREKISDSQASNGFIRVLLGLQGAVSILRGYKEERLIKIRINNLKTRFMYLNWSFVCFTYMLLYITTLMEEKGRLRGREWAREGRVGERVNSAYIQVVGNILVFICQSRTQDINKFNDMLLTVNIFWEKDF